MSHLDEADVILAQAERFDDAVYAVAGEAKYGVDAPFDQCFDQDVRCGGRGHTKSSSGSASAACRTRPSPLRGQRSQVAEVPESRRIWNRAAFALVGNAHGN